MLFLQKTESEIWVGLGLVESLEITQKLKMFDLFFGRIENTICNVLSKLIDLYFLLRFISKKSKDACKHAFSLFLSYFDNFLIKCHSIIWICQKPKMSKLGTRVLVYNSLPENKCNRKISKQFYIISTVLLFCTLWLFWLKRGM